MTCGWKNSRSTLGPLKRNDQFWHYEMAQAFEVIVKALTIKFRLNNNGETAFANWLFVRVVFAKR